MNLTLIKYAAALAIPFAAGFGTAWQWRAITIANIQLEHKDERIASQRAARVQAERRVATQRAAELQAQSRMERLAVVVDSNRTELERLHDVSDAARRAAASSLEACTAHAATQGGLLDHCAARLVDVSAAADGHVSDIKTLNESWPD